MSPITPSYRISWIAGLLLTVLFGVLWVTPVQAAGVCRVKWNASGANNGSSWADAYVDLQSALHDASCTEIWVAAGTYKPTTGTDRTATFQLRNGVAVYGGFDGTESQLSQQNLIRNIAILSGEIGAPGIADNSYHVVTGSGTDSTAAMIGFTITGGNANAASPHNAGGGMQNGTGSPNLSYLTFTGNAALYGGGMSNSTGSHPILMYCTFSGNTANFGGAIYDNASSPILENVTISGNTSNSEAGGMANFAASNPTLTAVTISGNSAYNSAGGMENSSNSNPVLKNVTISGNTATHISGGGLYNQNSSPVIRNTLIWGNTAAISGAQIYDSGGTPTVSDSIVQGGYAGVANIITADPHLGTLGDYGGLLQTVPLLPGSSAIDAGNPTYCTWGSDERGRIYHNTCDIGAFESLGFSLATTSGNNQATPINTAFANPLAVTVTANDPFAPVAGGVITFTPPASGAGTQSATTTVTVSGGAASLAVSANGTAGAYAVTAATNGAASVAFSLENLPYPGPWYVKPAAGGAGTCQSWADACTLQTALANAGSGSEIWVAAGTYTPGTQREDTFQLKSGVALYGGFAGTENDRDERDPVAHPTVLSGDIDHNDSQSPIISDLSSATDNYTNSYHVVTTPMNVTGAVLDGFIITAGYADQFGSYNGAGMLNLSGSSPTLAQDIFIGNYAASSGGGMANLSSSPSLSDVTFKANLAWDFGGGMYNTSASPTITNATFSDNWAQSNAGGGMFNESNSNPALTNVTFFGNSAVAGSAMANSGSSPLLTNVTMLGYFGLVNQIYSHPVARNTILWGGNSGATDASSTFTVTNSVIQDGCTHGETSCTNVSDGDPRLGDAGNYGGFNQTIPLLPGSSAIDGGDPTACTQDSDERGVAYVGRCDIGAFESRGFTLTVTSGDDQTTPAYRPFAQTLGVTVSAKAEGEPVDGGMVSFTAPKDGASASLDSSAVMIQSGAAGPVSAGANDTSGSYTVEVTANGADPVSIHLTNGPAITIVFHVKLEASGSGDCLSWENACTLQTALGKAFTGDEVWVSAGTYTPADSEDSFVIAINVAVYGGFAGTETERSERDPAAHLTILSGDFNHNDSQNPITGCSAVTDNPDHSSIVVMMANKATLDGVTITGGYNPGSFAGGLVAFGDSQVVSNVIICGNEGGKGGGMVAVQSNLTLSNVTFSGNSSGSGGGLFVMMSNPTLTNVTFSGNRATASAADHGLGGGGLLSIVSTTTLTNVTFSGNHADGDGTSGGGIVSLDGGDLTLRNAILWGNSTNPGGDQIFVNGVTLSASDSVVQGGVEGGTHILTDDPLLGDLGTYGGFTPTFPLLYGSPAIDAGNDATCAPTDQRGKARLMCDMGAFESQGYTLAIAGGDGQSTQPDTAFADPLAVTVTAKDAGLPVDGVVVTFSPPENCDCATLSETDVPVSGGKASVTATAGDTLGSYNVIASAPHANSVTFTLANLGQPTLSVTNSPVIYNGQEQAAVVVGSVAGTVSNVRYDGSASLPIAVGTYAVTADFAPDDGTKYTSLTGAPAGNFVIATPATTPTATMLKSSLNPAQAGQAVTFTATVMRRFQSPTGVAPSKSITPTGVVTFKDGLTILGTGDLVGGSATFTTADLSVGDHRITAEYAGEGGYASSTSAALTQSVSPAPPAATTVTLAASRQPLFFGETWTLTATVTSGATPPAGTVTFKEGETILGTSELVDGKATLTLGSLALGAHTITAEYDGIVSDAVVVGANQYLLFPLVFA